jgi:hypothetical protein
VAWFVRIKLPAPFDVYLSLDPEAGASRNHGHTGTALAITYFVSASDLNMAQCVGDRLVKINPLSNEALRRR